MAVNCLGLASILALMTIHGTIPYLNAPSLEVQSISVGPVKCAEDNLTIFPFTCKNIGYPVGW
jgi:hypothetical protein